MLEQVQQARLCVLSVTSELCLSFRQVQKAAAAGQEVLHEVEAQRSTLPESTEHVTPEGRNLCSRSSSREGSWHWCHRSDAVAGGTRCLCFCAASVGLGVGLPRFRTK